MAADGSARDAAPTTGSREEQRTGAAQVPNQWAHVHWTRRQSPEWKPRRASVAACQLHNSTTTTNNNNQLQQQQRQHSARTCETRRDSLTTCAEYTATNVTLRKFLSQRLAKSTTNNLEAQCSGLQSAKRQHWQLESTTPQPESHFQQQHHDSNSRSQLPQERQSGDSYLSPQQQQQQQQLSRCHQATALRESTTEQAKQEHRYLADHVGQPDVTLSSAIGADCCLPDSSSPTSQLKLLNRSPLPLQLTAAPDSADRSTDQPSTTTTSSSSSSTTTTTTTTSSSSTTASSTSTCCSPTTSTTPTSPTAAHNELQVSKAADHLQVVLGMDEKLQMQDKQRKFLILSMALKRMAAANSASSSSFSAIGNECRSKSCASFRSPPMRTSRHLQLQPQSQHHQNRRRQQHQQQRRDSTRSVSAIGPLTNQPEHEEQQQEDLGGTANKTGISMNSPANQPPEAADTCCAAKQRHLSFCAASGGRTSWRHSGRQEQRSVSQHERPEVASSYCTSPRSSSSQLTNEDDYEETRQLSVRRKQHQHQEADAGEGENVPDLEALIVESWLDDNPSFVHDYFMRKASHQLVDDWLIAHAKVSNTNLSSAPEVAPPSSPIQVQVKQQQLQQHHMPTVESRRFLAAPDSGASTPVRKISATDFESRSGSGFLRPMVSTTPDGRPTFLAASTRLSTDCELDSVPDRCAGGGGGNGSPAKRRSPAVSETTTSTMQRVDSRTVGSQEDHNEDDGNGDVGRQHDNQERDDDYEDGKGQSNHEDDGDESETNHEQAGRGRDRPRRNDEMKLIFELVKNICNDLDIRTLLHKILKNIAVLINADKSSLFLVNGPPGDPNRHLVSQLFNVDQDSELASGSGSGTSGGSNSSASNLNHQTPITIPWGTGLVGYVAESGEAVNIANCYEDPRFTDTIDQRTGYVTRHMLCAPILDKRNEIVGVAQVINKRDGKPFTRDDEKRFKRYLQFCGIGLRNAQSYEHCQLENRRNQVLLDLARMVFEEQSTIEQVVYRIMLHTQSLLDCQRCQVLLIDDGSDELDQLLQLPHCSNSYNFYQQRPQQQQQQQHNDSQSSKPPEWRPQCVVTGDSPEVAMNGLGEDDDDEDDQVRSQTTETSTGFQHNDEQPAATTSAAGKMDDCSAECLSSSREPSSKLFSLVFDLECEASDLVVMHNGGGGGEQVDAKDDDNNHHSGNLSAVGNLNGDEAAAAARKRRQFPINIGITGYVAMTGETLNIEDAHKCDRFDRTVDEASNFKHKSILCMPIRNGQRRIIGVSQLINKKNGRPFNKNDEDLFEAFAIFCGLGIHNTLMYERVLKIMAKQRVTFEVLSYHATAPLEEARKLNQEQIPSCFALNLTSLKFNDFSLDEQFMLKACLRFFLDLDLIRRFQIDRLIFCNWILSVQKNYRKVTYHPIVGGSGLKASPVRYHNWRHAFNVSQMMFAILINTQICQTLGELETLALLIACLCHDLDHRGTNNSFQKKSASPLAELYSTSTMEHHHFDQCVMILNSQGNQILANLSPDEYSRVIMLLKEAIIATDLANYFQKRELFFKLVNGNQFNWKQNPEHRSLLRCMLMTACDVAAITKPWSVQKVVADLVRSEFYQQGDLEKEEFNIEPIDMMNRDKMSKLPEMQIGFIDSICAPIYTAFARLFPRELTPLLDGCIANRNLWAQVAEGGTVSGVGGETNLHCSNAHAASNEPPATATTTTCSPLKVNASSPEFDTFQSCNFDDQDKQQQQQQVYSDCSLRSSCSSQLSSTNDATNCSASLQQRPILIQQQSTNSKLDGQRKSV